MFGDSKALEADQKESNPRKKSDDSLLFSFPPCFSRLW